ncbi:MAG: MFS transporter [Candidatus Bathycorpusculaceae bacterium]
MALLLRNKNFLSILLADIASEFGNFVLFIAIAFYIYEATSSALDISGIFIAKTLSLLFVSLIAGVYIDRYNKKKIMIVCDLGRVWIVFLTVILLTFSQFSFSVLIYLYLMVFIMDAISLLSDPSRSALIPFILAKNQLKSANSLLAVASDSIALFGPIVAAFIIEVIGRSMALLFVGLTFIISIIMLSLLDIRESLGELQCGNFFKALKDGLLYVKRTKSVLLLLLISGIIMLGGGAVNAFFVVYSADSLGAEEIGLGMLFTGIGGGFLIGSFLMTLLGQKIRDDKNLVLGMLMVSIAPILWSQIKDLFLAVLVGIWNGIGNSFISVSQETLLQKMTSKTMLGRVMSLDNFIVSIASVFSIGVAGVIVNNFGVAPLFFSVGCMELLATILGFLYFHLILDEAKMTSPMNLNFIT